MLRYAPAFSSIMNFYGYGHLDVFLGEYSKNNVSKPNYEWIINHRMLERYGKIKFENK